MIGSVRSKHVSLLSAPNVMVSTLAGLYDVFNCFGALGWFDEALAQRPPFEVDLVGLDSGPVVTATGLTFPGQREVHDIRRTDIIIVPSLMVPNGQWQTGGHPELVRWLIEMNDAGAELCSACSGTLLMAETGLLDGRMATMHWAYAKTFRRNFPAVDLRLEKALITEGERNQLVMSGAASSWNDLALYLIARHLGPATAQAVAKFFAFQWHTEGMAVYAVFEPPRDHGDAAIDRAQEWAASNFGSNSPVERMARRSGLAERSFKRRFRRATGLTPIQYVQELRLDEAKRQLERTKRAIDDIAWDVGYEDPAYFRRLFKRRVGITPGTYRRKFRIPGF